MLYKSCKLLIQNGMTEGLQEKLDMFYLRGRLTQEQYAELSDLLAA